MPDKNGVRAGEFTLDDFRVQLERAKPGRILKMLGLLPGMGDIQKLLLLKEKDLEGSMKQTVGIINSMTREERRNPEIIHSSRRHRIAAGAGVQPQDVNQLVRHYRQSLGVRRPSP